MIDLERKTFVAFGLRLSGKSTLCNYIASEYGTRACLFDTLGEAPANARYSFYVPKDRYSTSELEAFNMRAIIPAGQQAPNFDLYIIDEANRFCPPKPSPLPRTVAQLNDEGRHYPMSVGFIARRPCQLNQDLTELADYMFLFRLVGTADYKYLENLIGGLGDVVFALPDYHFVTVFPDRKFKVMKPINPAKGWLAKAEQEKNRKKT